MDKEVKIHDVIQLLEDAQPGWDGCLMIVSEVRDWGVIAYMKLPMQGDAYLRVPFSHFEVVGHALLIVEDN